MRSSYRKTPYSGSSYLPSTSRSGTSSTSRSSAYSTERTSRTPEPTVEKDKRAAKDDSDVDDDDAYADLRAKLRALQSEALMCSSRAEALEREKEEMSVALGHAKRDKVKATASADALEIEKEALERDNRRLKNKLEQASKELRDLNEERRDLGERLKVSETLRRSTLADEKDTRGALNKLQDEIQQQRTKTLQLEEKLSDTQDQLRRAKLLQSIQTATPPAETRTSTSTTTTPRRYGPRTEESTPRHNYLATSVARERHLALSSESTPPSTPTRNRTSSTQEPSSAVKLDSARSEHLKVELESAKRELSSVQENNRDLTKKLRDSERTLSELKAAQRDLESEQSKAHSAAKSASRRADEADQRRKELIAENEALREADSKLRSQIEQAQRDLSRAREEANHIRAQVDRAEAQIKKETEAKHKIAEQLSTIQRELGKKEAERAQVTRSASKSALDLRGTRDEVSQLESKQSKLEKEVQALNAQVTQLTALAQEKQNALDAAHHDARTSLDKIKELSNSLANQEETNKKVVASRKKAEDRVAELEQTMVTKEHAREAAASELERRKKDLELKESEIQQLKKKVETLEKATQDAQQEASDAKLRLDRADAELKTTAITIDQLQREATSQQNKALAAATQGANSDAQLELQLRQLSEQLATAKREKTDAEAKYNVAEKERSKHLADLRSLQTDLHRANADLNLGGRIVTDLQAQIKDLEQKLALSERLQGKEDKLLNELRSDLSNAKKELKIKDGILSKHQSTISELNTKLKEAEEKAAAPAPAPTGTDSSAGGNSAAAVEAAPATNTTDQELASKAEKLQEELDALQKSLEETQSQLTLSKHSSATMAMKLQALQSTVDTQSSDLKKAQESMATATAKDAELEKLRRDIEMGTQLVETSQNRVEKLQSELEKTKAESGKQAKSDAQLRKTLAKQCEHWQHTAGGLQEQIEKIKKEMVKNGQIRAALEPIIGGTSATTTGAQSGELSDADVHLQRVVTLQAYCRGALERKASKNRRYRYLKMKEIVETEESYLKILELGWCYFLHPLQTMIKLNDPIITQEEVSMIFSSMEEIRKNNKEVLGLLRARLTTWHVEQLVGDVFNNILDLGLLQPHVVFAQAYSKSTESRVRVTKENSGFSRLLAVIRMVPPMEGRSLEDILISPIQRIPRYILLLNDMVKHTPPTHPDASNLRTALERFQEFATFINENNRRAETMTDISARLSGYESLPANRSRKLLHEGRLNQISGREKIPRYVFLFNDYVVFGKESKNTKKKGGSSMKTLEAMKVTTKFVAMIKIGSNLTITEIGNGNINGSPAPHLLNIMVGESSNVLQAASDSDMKLWVGKLKEAVESSAKSPKVEPSSSRSSTPSLLAQASAGSSTLAALVETATNGSSSSSKDRSKRLSVGSASGSTSSTPSNSRPVSPSRTASMSAIHSSNHSTPPIPEDAAINVTTVDHLAAPQLQASTSSSSIDGSSRKARTLSKRHKGEKGGSRAE